MVSLLRTKTFNIVEINEGFEILLNGIVLLRHSVNHPILFVGHGEETMEMYRGNFDIKDYIIERAPLKYVKINLENNVCNMHFSRSENGEKVISLEIKEEQERLKVSYKRVDPTINRFWLRLVADTSEKVYGCGEQLSYFNLRGKNFPLWTSEPGVGRNKKTYTTWQADVIDKAGGDYYNTNFPQPLFVSSKKYYCHTSTTAYADFNFCNESFHELQFWEIPEFTLFEAADSYIELVEKLTALLGRQPELPEWIYNGIILGIQGGTDSVNQKLNFALKAGMKVAGVWCQDWQGKRITSFGKRLMWDWKWNEEEYPELDKQIHEWKEKGIRFLSYINPYVAVEGDLYNIAKEKSYLAFNEKEEIYLVDFGEFYCGVVDFTNEKAVEWYKSIIKENMIDFGIDGWMADFGEYLPIDVILNNGIDAKLMHNIWPTLWAKVNYEAVKESGKLGEVFYFMRAGYTGIQKYCTMLWAGDQSVDWSLDDGLASVIPAALSSGMSGMGLHHSDIGGYTSLHGNKRSKELLLRWVEMNAFTPLLRTHEGNRPDDCIQFDEDEETIQHFVKMTDVYVHLAPYIKSLVKENAERGIPVQRPLFMHYENDYKTYDIKYQYLLGKDILVAPVYEEGQSTWKVYLPKDNWIHMWSGEKYIGGEEVTVPAPIGKPPVFYREKSEWKKLFEHVKFK